MCRIPKVVVIAPADGHLELRRALSSLEYDIVATLAPGQDVDVTADVAIVREPDGAMLTALRERGLKIAAFGPAEPYGADLELGGDVADFKTRVWDLLRARP